MATDKTKIVELEGVLNGVASGLAKVTSKKMFGCHALFANGNVFALVWKHGQIGVKLTDEGDYENLLSEKGTDPWKAGPMKMAHWVLVSETIQSNPKTLTSWVHLTHKQAISAPPKKKNTKAASGKKKSRK
jgi:TfoX/Sxy family transcriptional regulator of competence genes